MSELYIGLMSGTSFDGIDAALVDFSNESLQVVAVDYQPFSSDLKQEWQVFTRANATVSLKRYGEFDTHLGQLFAQSAQALLAKANVPASAIKAIGSHGQTVYHHPHGTFPFSLQIGDPNVIAHQTGITTVADFRRKDIAAGGQGAPLVPAFHHAMFHSRHEKRCIVNIGGIANITVLPADDSQTVMGFDTGMGNALMDSWIQQHQGFDYDKAGAWAKSGRINMALVEQFQQDAYFSMPPPKSTGKEHFSLDWLKHQCHLNDYAPVDVQASLCYLTAVTIAEAIKQYAPQTQNILLCGGGCHNAYLLELLAEQLGCPLKLTDEYGVSVDYVEAIAFAWLARQTMQNRFSNLPSVTGAKCPVILGGIY